MKYYMVLIYIIIAKYEYMLFYQSMLLVLYRKMHLGQSIALTESKIYLVTYYSEKT